MGSRLLVMPVLYCCPERWHSSASDGISFEQSVDHTRIDVIQNAHISVFKLKVTKSSKHSNIENSTPRMKQKHFVIFVLFQSCKFNKNKLWEHLSTILRPPPLFCNLQLVVTQASSFRLASWVPWVCQGTLSFWLWLSHAHKNMSILWFAIQRLFFSSLIHQCWCTRI